MLGEGGCSRGFQPISPLLALHEALIACAVAGRHGESHPSPHTSSALSVNRRAPLRLRLAVEMHLFLGKGYICGIAVGQQAQCVDDYQQRRTLMHCYGRADPQTKDRRRHQNGNDA